MSEGRVPPHNLQAEFSMLGVLLHSRDARENGLALVSGGDFYQQGNGFIFDAIYDLYQRGEAIEIVTVEEELRRNGVLDYCGGVAYLRHLRNEAPGYAYQRYAEIIASHASMRQLIELCEEVVDDTYNMGEDVSDIIDRLKAELDELATPLGSLPDGFWSVEDFRDRPKTQRPEWVIRGLLRVGWRAMIVAVEGFGKTMLLHQIALCASRGVHPFVTKASIPPVNTLLVDCENPEDRLDDGFEFICPRLDEVAPVCPGAYLWTQPGGINLRTRADRAKLENLIARVRPKIVCAGPVYKTFVPKPGDTHELVAREVQAVWDSLRTRYGFALVLEAHASKGSGGVRNFDPEGSALWLRWSEFGLKMLRSDRNSFNEDVYYDVKRFRLDRIRQHGWPSGLERATYGMPWAARWDNADWKQYITCGDDVMPEAPSVDDVADIEDDDPF